MKKLAAASRRTSRHLAPRNTERAKLRLRAKTKLRHVRPAKKRRPSQTKSTIEETAEKLRKCNRRLKDIQRIAGLGTWEWDIPAHTVVWSDELYRIHGQNRKDFQTNPENCFDLVHPEDRNQMQNTVKRALENERFFTIEIRIIRPDGAIRLLEAHGEVMVDKHNHPVRILGCSLDITERKRIEKKLATSLSLLNATLESTADGILVVDMAGHLVSCNRKFLEMWQLPHDLVESYDDDQALAAVLKQLTDPAAFMLKVRHLYEHPELESFDVLEFKDGKIFERFSLPQKIGETIVGRVWSFRDVTRRYFAQETLRQSEERYRSLIIATSQVVWTTDAEGHVIKDLPQWREFTGQNASEIIGDGWLDAIHPDDRDRAAQIWSEALATRSIYQIECRLRRADGEWRNMLVRGVPIIESDGQIREWIGFCLDITQRKKVEQIVLRERDFMDGILNSLPGIFYLMDENGQLLRWNKNLETLSGYSAEEIARMPATNLVPEEEREMVAEKVQHAFTAGHADAKSHFLCKDGRRIPYFCTGTRVDFEDKPQLVGMGIDISQLQRAKEEIKKLNKDLARRVKERTAQLNTTNKELEAFSYSVSHDLRAPLRAISGFAKILKEDYGPQLDEEGLGFVEKILLAGERMSRLIDDLLTYSRIGKIAIHLQPVSLSDLLEEIAADFTDRIQAVGGTLLVSPNLPVVQGDPTLLGQVFANLIENAFVYRRQDVPLEIAVTAHSEGTHAVVCIKDNGIGIDPAHHERIFEVFQRLHSQKYPGTGIGLANAKKSIELLSGKIWVESEPDKGSTFCVELKSAEKSAP